MADTDLPEHDVAIVVYARVRAHDELDAAYIARAALQQRIGWKRGGVTIQANLRNGNQDVQIAGAQEVGSAARNGGLWVHPTGEPFRTLEPRPASEDPR